MDKDDTYIDEMGLECYKRPTLSHRMGILMDPGTAAELAEICFDMDLSKNRFILNAIRNAISYQRRLLNSKKRKTN